MDLSRVLKISTPAIRRYFSDGRKIFSIIEETLAKDLKGIVAPIGTSNYDITANNNKYEVRSITKSGVYFCPSNMVGSGRKFDEGGFLNKLDCIDYYILTDITKFPKVPYYIVPCGIVNKWWKHKELNSNTKVCYNKCKKLLKSI